MSPALKAEFLPSEPPGKPMWPCMECHNSPTRDGTCAPFGPWGNHWTTREVFLMIMIIRSCYILKPEKCKDSSRKKKKKKLKADKVRLTDLMQQRGNSKRTRKFHFTREIRESSCWRCSSSANKS